MAELSLRNVRKSFSGTEVIHDVNLDVESGAFVVFVAAVAASALMLVLHAPIEEARPAGTRAVRLTGLSLVAVLLVLAMAALNTASTLIECGFESCPDNPTVYRLLQ